MLWGCFWAGGMGPLRRVDGKMDRFQYADILEKTMRPYALKNMGRAFIYQQDNDPKHSSLHVKDWFRKHRVTVLDRPSQSPDLNIIEHLGECLERSLRGARAKNADEKFAQLEAAWAAIPQSTVDKLIDSMPRRCEEVIKANGFATRY